MDKETLEKHQYRLAGSHSAVKICTWTKNSIRNQGVCYKEQFYGIKSHRCVQMSPTLGFCHNQCVFCWRPIEETINLQIEKPDDPDSIIDKCLEGQRNLLNGFGGNEQADKEKLSEAMDPKHFAISLTGEPTLYPELGALLNRLHERGFSTFLVTNGMEPKHLKNLLPTQLYLSVDAPTEELFNKIDRPSLKDGWNRLAESLRIIKDAKTRTCLRFTMIKGMNMIKPDKWAEIIELAQPDFVELKSYMHVGFSKHRMKTENMPTHIEVRAFADQVAKHSKYQVIDEHRRSRAVLLMVKDFKERVMTF